MLSCIFNHPGKLCSYWPQMTRPRSTNWKIKMLPISVFILDICIIILEDQMQIQRLEYIHSTFSYQTCTSLLYSIDVYMIC